MATKNANRTHAVTFVDGGRRYYAVKSREYGDQIPMGIDKPELRCAMTESDATRMADFLKREAVHFRNITVHTLNIKRKAK